MQVSNLMYEAVGTMYTMKSLLIKLGHVTRVKILLYMASESQLFDDAS